MNTKQLLIILAVITYLLPINAQVSKTINVTTPGTLSTLLTSDELNTVTQLTITGQIDQRDFISMRDNMPVLANIDMKTVTISAYNGNASNSIPDNAFYIFNESNGKKSLKSIILPDAVTSIRENAFLYCSGLTSIAFPNALTSIEGYAFSNCKNLKNITLPNTLTSIGESAFDSCSGLTSITLPNALTSIESHAFENCSGLTSITLPNALTSIESHAFENCSGLTSITLPNALTSIGESAFNNCSGLTSITLPNTLTTLGARAFEDCSSLTSITLSNALTVIKYGTFSDCTSLTNITLPDALTTIESSAFYYCIKLKSIAIKDKLTSIGELAFGQCDIFTFRIDATVPPTMQPSYGDNYNFIARSVYVPVGSGASYQVANGWKDCLIIEGAGTTLHLNLTTAGTLASEIVAAGYSASNVNNLILEGVLNNDDFATIKYNMRRLISIDLSATKITTIPATTFQGIERSLKVSLPATITTIEDQSFASCRGLYSITLPSALTTIGSGAFYGCYNLTAITFPATLTNIKAGAFEACKGFTDIVLPNALTTIETYAFKQCSNLKDITFPTALKTIRYRAFEGCSSLTTVALPATITTIEVYAFMGCTGLTSISLPLALTTLGSYAFQNCSNLKSVTLPYALTTIGEEAFGGCTNLAEIKTFSPIPQTIKDNVWYGVNKDICKLMVPKGAITAYMIAPIWGSFTNISEMNTPNEFSATITKGNGGNIQYNSVNLLNGQIFPVTTGQILTFKITPNNGYSINKVLYNNEDVTSQLNEGSFTTPAINASVALSVTFSLNAFSNASLMGTWVPVTDGASDHGTYIIFDGNGIINESGDYYNHKKKDIGTYTVTPSGAMTFTASIIQNNGEQTVFTCSGQFITPDSLSNIAINSIPLDPLTNYMIRTSNPGELAGTWNGSIYNSDYANLSITIDNSGKVTSPSTWIGHVFTRMGKVIGFIQNDDGTCWNQFTFGDCTFDGNNNIYGPVNSECTNTKGTISLTRLSTGINEQITDKLIIYPNPASNEFYLNLSEKNAQVSIYDLNGGLCLTQQVYGNEYINVSKLPKGVYMVKVTTEKGMMISKLIKE